ncbi:phage tail protein [Saccharospirillum alexandrii]|uniref:phage tail protein n=1 Tax=Saccharospirillum alexandrii TaxID=2448477 RepID=UPI000FDCBFD9|nr:phage tail protein [Saccharospirillum alexandrii]
MANGFSVNAHRYDPYKNFKFRILWDNKPVLGVSKISSLKRTTEVVKFRSGGENAIDHKSPGRTSYEAITVERGLTHDPEFEAWASKVHTYEGDSVMDLANYKKELSVEFMNEKGQVAYRYYLHNCWVSEYTALPDLDANANAVSIESMKIELEGWERDPDTQEPNEGA